MNNHGFRSNIFTNIDQNFYLILKVSRAVTNRVTSKKLPNVYKKWPKTEFTRKIKYLDTFNKLTKNVAIWEKYLLPQA